MPDGFILVKGRVLNGLRDFQQRNYDLYRAKVGFHMGLFMSC
jgi:hypothetical protein